MTNTQSISKAVITSVGSAINGGTADGAKPVIAGTADVGTTVNIYDGVRLLGTATVAADSTWSFTPTADLKVGSHQFTAIAVDASGSFGASSTPLSVTVPSSTPVAPAKPIISGMTDDQGHPLGNPTNDVHPNMSGTGTPGDTITMYDGPTAIGSTTVKPDGTWTVEPTKDLSSGTHDIYVIETNPAGTPSAASDHTTLVVDASVPATPAAPILTDDGGAAISSSVPAADATPHISGRGTAGDTITVYDGQTALGTAMVDLSGNWTFVPSKALGTGTHSFTVIETNLVGTASAQSPATSMTLAAPSITITAVYDHDGNLVANGGALTGTMTVTGTVVGYATGDQVMINVDGPTVNSSYAQTYVNVTVVNGQFSYTFAATTTDQNGHAMFSGPGSFTFMAAARHTSPSGIFATSGNYQVTDTNWNSTVSATRDISDTPSDDATVVAGTAVVQDSTAAQAEHHTVVGEHDVFKGAATNGNETVDLNAEPASYFKEPTAHIQGAQGTAVNTLHLTGDHQILDLTSLTGKTAAAKISGIEVIDLGGHENNLKLSLLDVLNLGETDLFQKDGKQQLMVNGSDGDKVDLSNAHIAGVADGVWEQEGTAQVGGVTYNVYEHTGAHTELLIQQGVQIALHN